MDLRQLRAVVAIVDHGGFTRAAAALHVAQPSLSQTVRTLETELGVELFHRTGRRVTLTAAGEALLEPARRALRDADTARDAAVAVAGLVAGHVDVVALPTLAVVPVAELVGRFRRAHPAVTVRLTEPDDPAALVAMLRDGRSELGFTELPLADDDLETRVLADQRYDAVLPPGSSAPDTVTAPIPLQRLADLPLVTTPPGTSTRHLADGSVRRARDCARRSRSRPATARSSSRSCSPGPGRRCSPTSWPRTPPTGVPRPIRCARDHPPDRRRPPHGFPVARGPGVPRAARLIPLL